MESDLLHLGVVVLPVLDPGSRRFWEAIMWKALDEMPEYKAKGKQVQRVLGGFGALGNPSSFHHPTIRQLRKKIKRLAVKPVLKEYVKLRFGEREDVNLEALFDRVCIRSENFGRPGAEDWHRDVYAGRKYGLRDLPTSLPGGEEDVMIGGWTNLSDSAQRFVGLVGSHTDEGNERGFSTFSKEQIKKFGFASRMAAQEGRRYGSTIVCDEAGEVIVPPGHSVLFLQRLIHAVKSGPQPQQPSLRLFHGFRLTTETVPLFDLEGVVANGGVPRIPSGQIPPMYSSNHYAFFSSTDKYRSWGGSTFKSACLFERTTPSGAVYHTPGSKDNVNAAANTGRYMPSLRQMGLWDESFLYSKEELDSLYPQPLFVPRQK